MILNNYIEGVKILKQLWEFLWGFWCTFCVLVCFVILKVVAVNILFEKYYLSLIQATVYSKSVGRVLSETLEENAKPICYR